MSLADTPQETSAGAGLDELEEQWLARLEAAPEDVDFFASTSRLLAERDESERLSSLLELADEHLLASDLWTERLALLRAAGLHWLPEERLHPEVVRTLEGLYADCPSFAGLAEHVGLFRAVTDLAKTWTKVDRLRSLMSYEIGSVVWMEGKGAGRVDDVNLALGSFRVDFADGQVTIGFGGAAKMLRPIPPGHVVHRRMNEPEALVELKRSDPPALLRLVLTSYDRPLTAGEVREILGEVVAESEWTGWWTAARRHRRLMVSGKGSRQRYRWAESSDAALAQVGERFRRASLADKLAIFRKNAGRDPELRAAMLAELTPLGERLAGERPAEAMLIWAELERAGSTPDDDAWSPRALVAGARRPAELIAGIGDRNLRAEAVSLARELREDWSEVYLELLGREVDPRILDRLAAELASTDAERLAAFQERVLNEPRKLPAALVWLGERVAAGLDLGPRPGLRLFERLLAAPRYPMFDPYRARLQKLYEAGGPFGRLIAGFDDELAARAARAVARAPLERADRRPIADAIELRFPSLRRQSAAALYALPQSIAAKRRELKRLLEEELPANRKAIETAREMGDLRENFEYKAARQRHEYLTSRAEGLERDLRRVRPIEPPGDSPGSVRIGCRVELESGGGSETITVLGPWESDPDRSIISYESELAQQLIGRAVGDTVQLPAGAARVVRVEAAVQS